ncbi:hypothetical protein [Sinomonas humi]|uniref:Uncharacterized protein n=1 Tax=Sinomonas humi TaxID=1338436 RepID=A0A0B2APY2_9MICC|nr:hypothetical protein [Sinomonas humi]KHL03918.1 hypothetical protein LK10_07610 [Sinomonas humi]
MNTVVPKNPARGAVLASPGRMALPAIPSVGMLITPFLPFASHPTIWAGIPAPLVWVGLMIVLTVVALRLVERSYLRAGGAERDRAELAGAELAGAGLAGAELSQADAASPTTGEAAH